MKSIRKCDEKVRAQQLGVEVGDKFIVLSPEDSYDEEKHNSRGRAGDVLVLKYDDLSSCPLFINARTGEEYYEYFSCLARYEDTSTLSEELLLHNVKFDMKAIAEELGVSLERAHKIVQTALFEKGVEWVAGHGRVVMREHTNYLYINNKNELMHSACDYPEYKLMSIKPQYSLYVKEEVETIEFNGKQYNKDDVAKALALLSPIN